MMLLNEQHQNLRVGEDCVSYVIDIVECAAAFISIVLGNQEDYLDFEQ